MPHNHYWNGTVAVAVKHRVSVNLSAEEYQELSWLAEKYRVSMAWLSRQAIGEFLERCQQGTLQLPLGLGPGARTDGGQANRD